MLSILRKAASSMAQTAGSSPADHYGASDDDLSAWEFVNASLSDDEDVYSFDGDDVVSEEDGVSGVESEPKLVEEEEEDDEDARASRDSASPKVIYSVTCLSVSPRTSFPVEMTRHRDGDGYNDDDEEAEEHEVDDYDFDDELVPWKLKHMLGKQRIRKMGKRGGPKLGKSKKLPYHHNRPGCLYGKHGFGVQHSFI